MFHEKIMKIKKKINNSIEEINNKEKKKDIFDKAKKKMRLIYDKINDDFLFKTKFNKFNNKNIYENLRYKCIIDIERESKINLDKIKNKLYILRKLFIKNLEKLISLDKYLTNISIQYDKNFNMIEKMQKIIGNKNNNLNKNLENYIKNFIKEKNINKSIKKYKYLLYKCNLIKNCLINVSKIQNINKENKPICKICFINISDSICIPCGHIFCKKCIYFNKLYLQNNQNINNNLEINNENTENINNLQPNLPTNLPDNLPTNLPDNLPTNLPNLPNTRNDNLFDNLLSIFNLNENNNTRTNILTFDLNNNINTMANNNSRVGFYNIFRNMFNNNNNRSIENIDNQNKCPLCRQQIKNVNKIFF